MAKSKKQKSKKKKRTWRWPQWSKRNVIIGVAVVLGLAAAIAAAIFLSRSPEIEIDQAVIDQIIDREEPVPLFARKIDGAFIENEGATDLFPVAVTIDNNLDSRPPAGLSRAQLVIEASVEGSITRFLAFYATDEDIDRIGPVRSARPYYLDWVLGVGALYAHSGGSPASLRNIAVQDVFDMNEFSNGKYYWRDRSRYGPHNLYTSTEKLNEALEAKGVGEPAYESWVYKEEESTEDRSGSDPGSGPDFGLQYSGSLYNNPTWKYHEEGNEYVRYYGEGIHKDEDGEWIKAKNVIVVFTDIAVIDGEGRRRIRTVGEGECVAFLDGSRTPCAWQKEEPETRMRFLDENGDELRLNPGTTWIEIISPGQLTES